jgi:MerR family transcriptional regulator, thiopeptide resistance regulator
MSTMQRKLTLGRLARAVGLARASVLNYERLGLLRPAGRTAAGYRWYGEDGLERLRSIRRLREAGLTLPMIRELLKPRATQLSAPAAVLEARLLELCQEVERLRAQQQLLARLLATPAFRKQHRCKDKAAWVGLLRRAGLSEAQMHAWHAGFETDDPPGHAAFLESLGLGAAEIQRIRRWSRVTLDPPSD